jgi:hypothetical protein
MDLFAKEIDIAEPIWKDRSVGLAVDDVPPGQNVKVTISYKRKATGEQVFPGEYFMNVDKIRTYPQGKVGPGIRVHYVPIKDLTKTTLFSNNQNQTNMLFGSQELGKIIKESEDAKANGGNFENKKFLEPGKYIMILSDVKLEHAKSDGNPMVVVEFTKDDEHRSIKGYMKIAGPNTDISREQLVKLFHRGFGYAIQPCNTEKDLIDQLLKFKGKQLTVAVKGRKQAYAFEKDGKDIVMEVIRPDFWYAGMMSEFDEFYMDMEKAITDLSQEDKEKLIRFAEINGGPYIPKERVVQDTPKINPIMETQGNAGAVAPPPSPAKAATAPKKIEEVKAQPEPEMESAASFDWSQEDQQGIPMDEAEAPQPVQESAPTQAAPDDDFPF